MSETTKEKIIDATVDLIAKKGYAETTMRDIADSVGIKTSSIYYHFESKEAILDCLLDEYKKSAGATREHQKWDAELAAIVDGKIDVTAKKIMEFLSLKFDEQVSDRFRKVVKIICSEGVRNNEIREYDRRTIENSYKYIKLILDTLVESERIQVCDTAKMAGVLYSVIRAFMHLDAYDILYFGEENNGTDMGSLVEYVLNIVVRSTLI